MKVRSRISNNHAQNKKKIIQQRLWIKRRREKTKTSLWNRQGNEEPIFPTKSLKKSACKRKQESPQAKKYSKQHGSFMHSKSKTNQSLHMKMKCIFPIPMNNIYRKEQDFSRKEKNVKSNARNTNSLWMQKEYNNQSDYRIYNSWLWGSIFFQKYTSFSSKSKPKTQKIKIQSLEEGLPGTTLERSWQSGSGPTSLLANRTHTAN